MDGSEYVLIGKGQKVQDRAGGGVALVHRKERNLRVEKLDVEQCAMSEDILAVKVECIGKHGKCERFVVIVVYMMVEGERAVIENSRKCSVLRRIVRACWRKSDCYGRYECTCRHIR